VQAGMGERGGSVSSVFFPDIGKAVQISGTRKSETTLGASRCAQVAGRLSRTTRRNGGCIADPRHQSRMRE